MQEKFSELKCKEVINIADGCRLGYVCDVEIELPVGKVITIIVPGPSRFFGLFGRECDYCIPWPCIRRIGSDIILVDVVLEHIRFPCQKKSWFHEGGCK